MLTITDILLELRISRTTLWHLRRTGGVPAPVMLGTVQRWRRCEVEAWLGSQ